MSSTNCSGQGRVIGPPGWGQEAVDVPGHLALVVGRDAVGRAVRVRSFDHGVDERAAAEVRLRESPRQGVEGGERLVATNPHRLAQPAPPPLVAGRNTATTRSSLLGLPRVTLSHHASM
jgi:hypothetical protein